MTTTTAADRRAKAKADYDAFLAACPTRDLLSTITGKWVSLILAALADGSRRYSQLAERVAGISPKMLTQTLRTLEADGLVEREVTPDVPVRVDYRLTHLGDTLLPLILNIKTWAEQHMPEVDQARQHLADARDSGGIAQHANRGALPVFWFGQAGEQDVVVIAHRFAWALKHGVSDLLAVPVLGHRCDNPLCQRIGPGHLQRSSYAENAREWAHRGAPSAGSCATAAAGRVRCRAEGRDGCGADLRRRAARTVGRRARPDFRR